MNTPYRIDKKEDISHPIIVSPPRQRPSHMQESDDSYNRYVLRQRESHGRRTLLRLNFEVYGRKSSKSLSFQRLRNKHMLVSLPNGDQAEAFMRLIYKVAESLDGKFLATTE